ncbi:MAG TPA: bifunctional glutamate N-acetyltransferase/amino-acid acetyltransferase ArgJ [Gammaproteobacteria bacterium]|nr:bifunctional glutamate N-acetyltransferase/amino-acid acetyltransferase ArgJ [Gammaproteobacteria bacterium]
MMNSLSNSPLYPVDGIRLATVCAGIKKPDHRDLVIIEIAEGSQTAAVFTQNAFCAAPVIVAREHLTITQPRYLLVNTGNANAGTGEQGLADARVCCQALASAAGCESEAVLPFSTGVIGEPLLVENITLAIPAALDKLQASGWEEASWGILTTDTKPKCFSSKVEIDGHTISLTGMAKGAGMIRPDMATMLAYLATDAEISGADLQACLQAAVEQSFNRITVDGDTSTNDSCLLMATGKSGLQLKLGDVGFDTFSQALSELCVELARAMVRDGEGATKLIDIEVSAGASITECLDVAYTIAHSPLVKTAFFASDPNWGRILAAVGRAPVSRLDLGKVKIYLDEVCIVEQGGRSPAYTEEQGQQVMNRDEISVRVELGRGQAQANVWTCDFSYDYVRINAEYRT